MNVQLESFQGPFDLLLQLIEKQKIDIYEISIFEITEQYILFLSQVEDQFLETGLEFLVMISTLLEIKSKQMLFIEEEIEDNPEETLKRSLALYQIVKNISMDLKSRAGYDALLYSRIADEVFVERELVYDHFNSEMLHESAKFFLEAPNQEKELIRFEIVPVEQKIIWLKELLQRNSKLHYFSLIKDNRTSDQVALLLSLLELSKNQEICIQQEEAFGDITIDGQV